jgi:mannose-6-phosphate isomerase-like protein (cupin superfamily)
VKRPAIVQLDELAPVECPCGTARRAFAGSKEHAASVHLVEIRRDAQAHHHQKTTEIYLVLEGEGQMELDGRLFPIRPRSVVYIPPGCRHRAIGELKIINIAVPSFDPQDECLD